MQVSTLEGYGLAEVPQDHEYGLQDQPIDFMCKVSGLIGTAYP